MISNIYKLTALLCGLLILAACQPPHVIEEPYTLDRAMDLRDTDVDGVINARDFCSDTILSSSVDISGCSEWEVEFKHRDFQFYFGIREATLNKEHEPILMEIVEMMKTTPSGRIRLVGDTSADGSAKYNQELARQRAQAVADALVENGVRPELILDYAYTEPLVQELLKKRERRTIVRVIYREAKSIPEWNIFTSEEQNKEAF